MHLKRRSADTPRRLRVFLAMAFLLVSAAMAWLVWFALTPLDVPEKLRTFTVAPGRTLRGVAAGLVAEGLLREPLSFTALARISGRDKTLKAGRYDLPARITPYHLIEKLARGEVSQASITFIEGWTFAQMREALARHADLRHDSEGMSATEVLRHIGAQEAHPEGLFFPDTYLFDAGASDTVVLGAAYRTMKARLNELWAARAPGLPLTSPYEALILASIVEKETGRADERAMIAAVFVNRLKRGMRLQTDPSVIYGLGARFDGNLRKRHLETDSAYNSYTRSGLPPTPIALPGADALRAALQPARSSALYFVARGDGSSAFSATLEEHNRAVQRFQLNQ